MNFRYERASSASLFKTLFLCVLVLLCVAVPVTVSRYVTSDDTQDGAGVATFRVTQTGTLTQTITNVSFGTAAWEHAYTFAIENNSEVDVVYSVNVESSGNLPLEFLWDGAVTPTPIEGKKLESGGDAASHSLIVRWVGPKDAQYSGLIDQITVTVICEQTNTAGG